MYQFSDLQQKKVRKWKCVTWKKEAEIPIKNRNDDEIIIMLQKNWISWIEVNKPWNFVKFLWCLASRRKDIKKYASIKNEFDGWTTPKASYIQASLDPIFSIPSVNLENFWEWRGDFDRESFQWTCSKHITIYLSSIKLEDLTPKWPLL